MELNVIGNRPVDLSPLEKQAAFFKVLTHPARIAILDILRDGEHCVCHIEAYLGFRQAYISQQLAVLREAGLIQDRRDGWNIFYRVTNPEVFDVIDAVQKLTGNRTFKVFDTGTVCNCPQCSEK